jgi:hypothetical protein
LEVRGDLLPEITAQPLAWCNGCLAATNAHIYPDDNWLVVEVTMLSAGKGPGMAPPPRFFDATSLQEITDLALTPPTERGCGWRLILAQPVDGRIYRDERFGRYVSYNNLLVFDRQGALQTWRDGLYLGVTNPNTGQMYVPHGADTMVLNLGNLSPVGSLPPMCIAAIDPEAGRIYGLWERDLLVFSELGGTPDPAPTGKGGPLPKEPIVSIQPSPNYARDGTLFVILPGKLYRSTDRGQTWAQLRGGLPEGDYLTLDLAISPAFAEDQSLFVGGYRSDFWGEGVLRSTDRGDTWQPMWQDLLHLRVHDVVLSPEYGRDGTLLAYSRFQRLTPWQGGLSVFRSADEGLSWTLVLTQPQDTEIPAPEQFLPGAPSPTLLFRKTQNDQGVERSKDGGQSWEPLIVSRQPGFYVQAIASSPTIERDRTVYVLSEYDLFRSTDGGETWARWVDPRLAGRDYANKLATASTSPPVDGRQHELFVGTAAGEFWLLEPAHLDWEAASTVEAWPTLLGGEWVQALAAGDDDLWVGTWGNGLARVVDDRVQTRYTITDGLTSQYIGAVTVASDKTIWAGGDLPAGAARFDGRTWTADPFDPADVAGGVLSLAVGPDGTVWGGAASAGLLRWTGQTHETIPDPEGVTGWRVNDLEVAADGTVWCATARGLALYADGSWSGSDGGEAYGIELEQQGGIAYLLTSGATVWRYSGEQWTQLPALESKQYLSAQALYLAADGAVWLGTSSGAFRYDGQAWRQFTAENGLPANQVTAITEDARGRLWFGTESGVAHIDPAALELSAVSWPAPPTPTATVQAVPTAVRAAPMPARCDLQPAGPFAAAYQEKQVAQHLGCPTAEATVTRGAFQPFERGLMLWRADERAIYVLNNNGTWTRSADTWDEAQSADDPTLQPPQGLLQPVRGFGKVWREQRGGGADQDPGGGLGWALVPEQGYDMLAQPFSEGQILRGIDGRSFILMADGTWQSG